MAKGIEEPTDSPKKNRTTIPIAISPTHQLPITPTAPPLHGELHSLVPADAVSFIVNGFEIVIGDRNATIASSSELARIIAETTPVNGSYRLTETIDVNEFETILKFFETKFIKFQDVDDALRKLEFAKRFLCGTLVRRCVKEIDALLNVTNVIKVFRSIRFHVVTATPKKTPIEKKTPEECLESLLYNVLQFIDMNADVVLQRDEIIDSKLNFTEMELILRRDTLMTSEVVIYNLLGKWSRHECENRHLELTSDNRRRMLGPLSYAPRYLRMTQKEFDQCCQLVDILDPEEITLIREAFKSNKHSSNNLTDDQAQMLAIFKKARPKYARMPVHLSERSHPRNYSRKMRKHERSLDEDSQCSLLYWLCGCYAFICD